jgi:hypothetical protein
MGSSSGQPEFDYLFKVKYLTIGEKKLKLAIWDTGERSILLLLLFGIYVNVTHLVVSI